MARPEVRGAIEHLRGLATDAAGAGYCRGVPVQIARLAKLLGAPVHQATYEQVAALTAKKVREDADLDFKGSNTYIVGGDSGEELAKDVTGMASARGG
jgi:hypothetical protein